MGVITNSTSGAPGTTNVPEFLKDVLSDEIYVNAHTVLNPAGEVRGQPARLARKGVIYSLCAQQETGNVQGTKTGIGSGFISMDRDGMNLHFGMSVADLSGPLVGDHFHHGVHGIAGPIIFSLPTDSIINGFWDDSTFTTAVATEFMAGEIYNNFHTVLNPAGEIRGQVDSIDYCSFALGIGGTRQSAQFSVNVYPNPARETVAFDYSLPASGNVTITLFNDLGTLVSRTEQGSQLAGDHQQTYNLSVLPDGIYYYSVQLDGSAPVKGKLLVAK
jgi:hypothetical protein